jgi:hypothetical protein
VDLGGPAKRRQTSAISPPEVSTDLGPVKPAISSAVSTDAAPSKPAISEPVSAELAAVQPGRAPSASACEPYHELIAEALARAATMAIWQDLVDRHHFPARYASVRLFVAALRGNRALDAHVVITTTPGEEGQVDYGDGPMVRPPHNVSTKNWNEKSQVHVGGARSILGQYGLVGVLVRPCPHLDFSIGTVD